MKQLNFIDNKKTKPDYRNWVPVSLLRNFIGGTVITFILFIIFAGTGLVFSGTPRIICGIILGIGDLILLFSSIMLSFMYRTFDYRGKRKLAKTIIEGVAQYVEIPDGGVGLDVGCGSGALTIACAKRNPKAIMVGCDIWSGSYKVEFSKNICQENAKAEDVSNVRFEVGNAVKLPFEDESFDVVTSNYVYHNIMGHNKQKLLLETFRVLKKGGFFVIHDIMKKSNYGNIQKFIEELKKEGYEDIKLIDTTNGMFVGHREAKFLSLAGSTLFIGRK
ncbi:MULTISPECIES: class I SAM-dependent methyltransferase [Peptostreptococcus]|uniref:class I SAM-dependent methyltransferase n=1 Tax=Peptostreptococcus TaxID=1257 RepID=UPI000336E274|nr:MULTISPECIES: class I SAM-dependent methyltransferase [Peptostreptococcus]KXB68958.1 methyltransferase domain protein [Peptostreptococcus anaerobius]MDU1264992.1 class I SAM-dependent methyltransferase [Peptostreptococcus sp.]MDU1598466.1 class I SAM-dependent methyltransferase [Peptostreptococcus anaerobius]MDU1682041.1 class I SAM-dependent methyltransferase [Peptostreptococcus anaerobius]MDU5096844.1 class I SAM-dependent methyltransferase [Peptostreptococcus anaerobius]